ncbi:MAG: alkaline phosphatase family protein, partial [Thermodesulfobacteriota bacterium]
PNLSRCLQQGLFGELESIIPPITVPAWSCMMTSKDPGELGVYGFRNRKDHSYNNLVFATSSYVREQTVWDYLSRAGRRVVVLGVPQTFPPKKVNGCMISCFLTPSKQSSFTFPAELKEEVLRVADGDYIFDVDNFRTDDKDLILQKVYQMTERRFRVARHLLTTRPWDFFMMVEMGTDRIHHGFWKYFDQEHIKHEPGSKYLSAIPEYYRFLDAEIGRLLRLADDQTDVLIVSDHGAKRMDGGICINEWLHREGYLVFQASPTRPTPISRMAIDWSRTRVWGEGGYYSRIFLNVKGREPQGIVPPKEYEALRDELIQKLEALPDHTGKHIGTRIYKPQQLYRACRGVPPDLVAIFGDLYWRGVGTVGTGSFYTFDNDTGPDDANHAQNGILIFYRPGQDLGGQRLKRMGLMDIAPTVLARMGHSVPPDMQGKIISEIVQA